MDTRVDTTKIIATSRLVEKLSGMQLQCNKALVGKNAFSYGEGCQQNSALKEAYTYGTLAPESIGLPPTDHRMHMGKLSGPASLETILRELGYQLEKEQLNKAFHTAKRLLRKKRTLEEMDLRYIAGRATEYSPE